MAIQIIPSQKAGVKWDNFFSVICNSKQVAKSIYPNSSNRLLMVNNREKICNRLIKAGLESGDLLGIEVNGLAPLHNYCKMDNQQGTRLLMKLSRIGFKWKIFFPYHLKYRIQLLQASP